MYGQFGASAYSQVGVQTSVVDASPHRLIVLLYEGARKALAVARMAVQSNDIQGKGKAISKAIGIIGSGLRDVLDLEAGGEIAQRLDALYAYMNRRLMEATLRMDDTLIIEVDALLANLEDAWKAIGPEVAQPLTAAEV
ncbi:flagellar export chaperone FliS [Pararobbsia silviterrae]|uniref:Flagellar secretion chaperone FliS n=2 Tax=Pararobbsia silviterrae TaxID=1792498 RepID=A0A494XB76_9BURK|nr:flagellar export chaperone FliS [Pararobbsia silviterrae]RKP45384.1 flagellar export chaperone FliS [Pararobbsia silviterrae]